MFRCELHARGAAPATVALAAIIVMSFMSALRDRRFEIVGDVAISEKPSASLIAALGGVPAIAGITVTEASAQNLPVVFTCDRVIKEDVARAPIKLMRRLPDGSRQADPDHPVYSILHDMFNPVMTAVEYKETAQHHINIWGNHYGQIDRDGRNNVKAIWPLDPSRMTVDLNGLNQLRYRYRQADGVAKEWIFDPANPPILHIRINALDGIHGRGPVTVLREAMGWARAAQDGSARFFGRGSQPMGALQTANKLTPEAAARVRNDWERLHAGVENFHRVAILDHDLKWAPTSFPQKDAQFLETMKFQRSLLAGAFRVAASKINDLERATFSNIEHMAIAHVGDCLMPHFVRWQQAIARDLLNPKSFNTHFAVFVVDALVRGDIKTQNEALQLQRQNGVITANQWRRALDMDDLIAEEDGGDLYLVNGNMMPMQRDPAAVLTPSGSVN